MAKESRKLIANNKKAFHDYFIEDTWEAGIALVGTEVKSLRMGKCSLKESFIQIHKGEVFIYNMHISPYEKGNIFNKDPLRPRKLLVHRYEINKIVGKIDQKGYTLVPLQIYFKGSLVKVEFALAKGKKLYDKRADIAKKDTRREAEREFKSILSQKKRSLENQGSFLVELRGIEPLSESPFIKASPITVALHSFPHPTAEQQAARFSSFINLLPPQSLGGKVPCKVDARFLSSR